MCYLNLKLYLLNFNSHCPSLADDSDFFDIKCSLMDLNKTDIYNLGLALGLSQRKLVKVKDSSIFLDNVLEAWLHREDDVEKKGTPSWSTLVIALRHPILGQNGVAGDICKNKGIR